MNDHRSVNQYHGDPRGSSWAKWDLHVHTPASVIQHYGDGQQEQTWAKYIEALEALPADIKVLGINDYFVLDGYRRVVKEKAAGRLANISLVLPVVEFRISSFAGHKELKKVNYHVIFSDELTPDEIDSFFLRNLGMEVMLENGHPWRGFVCHRDGLIALGKEIKKTTPESKRPPQSDLEVGFNNAMFPLERIREAASQTMFKGRAVTVIGLAEWDAMRWESSAASKRDILNSADFVFTASPNVATYWERRAQLREQCVNDKLLHASDAHFYASSPESNRLGNVFTWLKAELTFRGLLRAAQRFDDRVYVCGVDNAPPKLERIRTNKGKYIDSIEIRKKVDATLDEKWFDCNIPINSDLVAVIGNQGNGKSALTDVIALCGNSKVPEFSFLTPDKFCDKTNKASSFVAILTWKDGTTAKVSLSDLVEESAYERVRYVPQRFFESVTNETVVKEGGAFYGEIKKAVFSHIGDSDRLACSNLDGLIALRAKEIQNTLVMLRQELYAMNGEILSLEKACSPQEVQRLHNEIAAKAIEIQTHRNGKPAPVPLPAESAGVNSKIEEVRSKEKELRDELERVKEQLLQRKQQREILQQSIDGINREHRQFVTAIDNFVKTLKQAGFEFVRDQLVSSSINTGSLSERIMSIDTEIPTMELQVRSDAPDSLEAQLGILKQQRESMQSELRVADQAYQAYSTQLQNWQTHLQKLEGSPEVVGSLRWLQQNMLEVTETKPALLADKLKARQHKSREVHQQLRKLVSLYQTLTVPVQEHIKNTLLTREKYRINFTINLIEHDIEDRLFAVIGHNTGTFFGVHEGREKLRELAQQYDFSQADDAIAFAEELLDNLKNNYRVSPSTPVDLSALLKKGHTLHEVYNLLFSFEYLLPQYALSLNGKPLKQLSPGERGILLLIFYLLIDSGDEPLIIDQPEGNLNNQSIYNNLVPVFKEAKNRRQIIVVTHNPNLAVVCDAEQIIHSQIDFDDGNRVCFDSGALENPVFNKLSLDVLEGTPPAFDARKHTYDSVLG